MHPHPVPDRVMSSVCLDFFELECVKGDDGKEYNGVMLCTDRLSGYMLGEPINFTGLTGEKAAKLLIKYWVSIFDVPVEITCDRDPRFVSAWFRTLCSLLGISIAYSKAYRKQENGRAETANSNVISTLRKMRIAVGDTVEYESWLHGLRAVLRRHNQRLMPDMGLSPHELLCGRAALGPAPCLPPLVESFGASQWIKRMHDMDRIAAECMRERIREMKDRYDYGRVPGKVYNVGDRVWVKYDRQIGDNKLVPFWMGPSVIQKRIGNNSYIVSIDDNKTQEAHISDLKIYHEALLGESVPLYYSKQYTIRPTKKDNTLYDVERIVEHNTKPCSITGLNKLYFRVRWKGFGEKDDTWEPAESFLPGYNVPWVRYCRDKGIALDIIQALPSHGRAEPNC